MKSTIINTRFILSIAIASFLFYACSKDLNVNEKKATAQGIQNSLADAQTIQNAVGLTSTTSKSYTLKVTDKVDPFFKTFLDNKVIREGSNVFNITGTKSSLNFVVLNGEFSKVLLIQPSGTGTISTDITARRKKTDAVVIDACTAAYALCVSRCSINGGPHDSTNPNLPCESACTGDFNNCRNGVPIPGVVLL